MVSRVSDYAEQLERLIAQYGQAHLADFGSNGNRPRLILPTGAVEFLDTAELLFQRLAKTARFFVRGTAPVELVRDTEGLSLLQPIRPAAFRTRIEEYFETWAWRHRKEKPVLERSRCPKETAEGLLETSTARKLLPAIQTVINCPIAINDGFGGLRILNAGYHAVNGGVLVVGGGAADGISLRDAVAALSDLLNEFDFQTPADRSRALAALISPALVFGGLISGRVPADVAEADQSQSGKTYRQKLIASIYNEVPYVIAKRDGGVGGLDESFSQALISARPFIQFDNLRGKMDSQMVEAYFTSDYINARVPHRGETRER